MTDEGGAVIGHRHHLRRAERAQVEAERRQADRGTAVDKTFRAFEPHQVLLPPSPDDWLPEGHLARFE